MKNFIKKIIFTLFFSILSISIFHSAYANEETIVFGPETFVRGTGDPVNEIRTFTPAYLCESGVLYISNDAGTSNKKKRVSSAVIKLNGSEIASSSMFNKNVKDVTVPVQVLTDNTLEVEVRSQPDSQISITISCVPQNNPPVAVAAYNPVSPVDVGTVVNLDGSGSSDPDGDALTYQWSIQSAPAGSLAEISDPNIINPTITPDLVGDYVIQLIVNDGILSSVPSSITITAQTPMVTVPDVVGLAQATAESTIIAANLAVGTITTAYSATVPAGDVISQNPVGGTSVTEGSSVNLEVSLGPVMVTVPNVVGIAQATAESTITAANLVVGTITTAYSATVPAGNVISQNPVGGTSVTEGSSVNLEVSLGPIMVTVPDVVGMAQTTAESTITAVNLVVGTITTAYSATVPAGDVISQNPAGGTSVTEGSSVSLEVSLGPVIVTIPNVVGMAQATAESTITAANLVVGTITTAYSDTVPAGDVTSQNPAAGTSVAEGSSVNLEVSLGTVMVTVPDVIGMNQSTAESTITSANLIVGTITTAYSDTVQAGDVISQNPVGGTSVAEETSVDFMVSLGPDPGTLPPDPETVAPELDQTVATTMAAATVFLYTGASPIQTGVAPGTIEPIRVAVLRGKVMERDGVTAISGVTITILNHPEYGSTLSREDGMFDMAVNGGGLLTVRYEKEGYITAQRKVDAPWQDYAWIEDVALVPYDPIVTVIDFSGPMQVATGSVETDADGSRQAVLLFAQGTTAEMVLPGGSRQPLATLSVRATEFTVGENGPQAMPAELPATSGYTYAVEFSAQEAIDAGASRIEFSQPVINYVENFLGIPVGEIVPLGYYDRETASWVPSDNGLVIGILSINAGGMAEIDLDGSGVAADQAALDTVGITDDERMELAELYLPGQELWRTEIPHFSTWDSNFGIGCASDPSGNIVCTPPYLLLPLLETLDHSCKVSGSVISSENQTLGENMDITGSPFYLHYQSDRVPGRKSDYTMDISISGSSLPWGITGIELEVLVAGREFVSSYPPDPNQNVVFSWDGKDAYGRSVQGTQPVTVRIGYTYDAVYLSNKDLARSFAAYGGAPISGSAARMELTLWQEHILSLGTWDVGTQGLGGWSINIHHMYDTSGKVLYLGNGDKLSRESAVQVINTVAGNSVQGSAGDGGPAVDAELSILKDVAVGSDGSFYIADTGNTKIRKVDPDGIITTIAGLDGGEPPSDGALAVEVDLSNPWGIAMGPDESVYFSTEDHYVFRVKPNGTIWTVAGNGTAGYTGDGYSATQASLNYPRGLAVDDDGSVYIVDYENLVIRRVSPDGIISTIAGGGSPPDSIGDGEQAVDANLSYPWGIDIGTNGELYIAEGWPDNRIRRVDPDGIITTFAGTGLNGYSGDGGPAINAKFIYPHDVAVGKDGSLYIADSTNFTVRKISPEGTITTIAGKGERGIGGDGGPATDAELEFTAGIAIGPDESIYVVSDNDFRVRRITPSLPGFSSDDLLIPSKDGNELYHFDSTGRHLRTINALTGADIYNFTYDTSGFLTQIEETGNGSNNITIIERDIDANPTAIIAPDGQRTELTLDLNGYLDSITDPENNTTYFSYSSDGLMETLTDPNNKLYTFTYDPLGTGRLIKDENPAFGYWDLLRTDSAADDSYTVDLTSAMGRKTTYLVENLSTGDQRRLVTNPVGLLTETIIGTDGSRTTTVPDGTITSILEGPDPRWSMQAPIMESLSITTPVDGLIYNLTSDRTTTLTNPDDLLSLTTQTDTTNINSRTYTSVFDASINQITSTTPESRQTTTTIDSQGRVKKEQIDNTTLYPVDFIYDTRGRLDTITRGTTGVDLRETKITYYETGNNKGFIKNITDPMQRTVTFEYDLAGKVKKQILPDLKEILYDYDANGNVTFITPPGRPVHQFTYTAVNLQEDYIPPEPDPLNPLANRITNYQYNYDKQLDLITRPDGQTIDFIYDPIAFGASNGLLDKIVIPRGDINYDYYSTSGNIKTITAPDLGSLTFTYDGSLLKNSTWAGTVNGSVERTYNNNFWISSRSVNGANDISYFYDDDGLLTNAGSLILVPDLNSGLLSGTTLGNVTDSIGYNSFGELESYSAAYSGSEIYSAQYPNRDSLGRITQKIETISGQTHTYDYDYYISGRLKTVTKDGTYIVEYQYDDNGNRLSHITPGPITTSGVPDDQDRLTSYGNFNYFYTNNGELLTKTDTTTSETTTYSYDVLGNLMSVTLPLPDETLIDYVIDGLNRRIGKKRNGVLEQGFLYKDQLNPIAELDGSGTVVSRFVYGNKFNVPDYMIKGGVTYRILSDHLGSPRIIIDTATGNIVQQIEYDEFGNIETDTNPGFQPFGFAGGIYDKDTKLTRFGTRDYDPVSGRWTSKDPITFSGGDTNLYGYVIQDPINFIDPWGLLRLAFDRNTGNLDAYPGDANTAGPPQRFPGVSGPFGNGSLPPGNYTLPSPAVSVPPGWPNRSAFCDASGNCWWQPIQPDFYTPRDRLGIHPDGNNPGTAGCIGVSGDNTRDLFDILSNTTDPVPLKVY